LCDLKSSRSVLVVILLKDMMVQIPNTSTIFINTNNMKIMETLERKLIKVFGWESIGEPVDYPKPLPKLERESLEQLPGFNEFMENIDKQLHPEFYQK